MEHELMEAFTYGKSHTEIGMPDIEAELLRVRGIAKKAKRRRLLLRSAVSVSACLIIVAGMNLALSVPEEHSTDFCIAYVGGRCITDESQVMEMLNNDISNMDAGEDSPEVQLNDFFNE